MPKKCVSLLSLVFASLLLPLLSFSAEAPKVITTSPQNGSQNVDPSLTEISVTFSEPMMDESWSWAYEDKDKFPRMTGQPYYADDLKRCVLPVKLEPKKEYEGIPSEPYKFTFRTR